MDQLKLIKKFRFSKVDGAQDDSFCFSKDGERFYNIERHKDSTNSGLSIYETKNFSVIKTFWTEDKRIQLKAIQCDSETGEIYVIGYNEKGYFAAILQEDGPVNLVNVTPISKEVEDYYSWCISLEMDGFTEFALEWATEPPKGMEYHPVRIRDLIE